MTKEVNRKAVLDNNINDDGNSCTSLNMNFSQLSCVQSEYCEKIINNFPKYGGYEKCSKCNNEFDKNLLFSTKRARKINKIEYICFKCAIFMDIDDICDWEFQLRSKKNTKRCERCNTKKSLKRYKKKAKGRYKSCSYNSLKSAVIHLKYENENN